MTWHDVTWCRQLQCECWSLVPLAIIITTHWLVTGVFLTPWMPPYCRHILLLFQSVVLSFSFREIWCHKASCNIFSWPFPNIFVFLIKPGVQSLILTRLNRGWSMCSITVGRTASLFTSTQKCLRLFCLNCEPYWSEGTTLVSSITPRLLLTQPTPANSG